MGRIVHFPKLFYLSSPPHNRIKFCVFILTIVASLLIYGTLIEPNHIEIREVQIKTHIKNSALKDKIIVHISDLHLSAFGKKEAKIINLIQEINPDLIFLTGDYIKWKGCNTGALKLFSQLKAKHGVYAVMGDYDYSDSKNSCLFCHEKNSGIPTRKHNVTMLRNSLVKINIGNKNLTIAGLDGGDAEEGILKDIEYQSGLGSPVIVLSHTPMVFESFAPDDKVILFSGDTHGGQVKLPRWLFKAFGYEKNANFNYGLYGENNKIMYVTRGIGTSHLKFRLFCPPEIAVIRLVQ